MLSELQDLRAIKRNLEESLQAMTDSDRQRAAQMKRFDDLRKSELARAKKDSDIEIRKLVSHVVVGHDVVGHVVVSHVVVSVVLAIFLCIPVSILILSPHVSSPGVSWMSTFPLPFHIHCLFSHFPCSGAIYL